VDGTPFGRYRLVEIIGRGGMGEVWRAYDTETQRVVALKVLTASLASDPTFEQRFRREAFAAAGLNDPHVVPIHNFGEIDGRLYVDMRMINGRDLSTLISDGPLDPSRAVHIIEQIASALNDAHQIGLVHRDIKPSNILVAHNDFAYLIDFGIARAAGETKMTNTGSVIGTWAYLAPERVTAGQTDPRCDTYALACVLHECLTGTQPFPGDSVEQQLGAHLAAPPPRPSVVHPGIPSDFDAVIATGMAKNPDERFPHVTDLAAAARTALNSAEQPAHHPTMPAAPRNQFVLSGDQPVSTTDPTQYRAPTAPGGAEAAPPAPAPGGRRRALWIAAASLLAVVAVVVGFAVSASGTPDSTASDSTTTSLPANTGPLTGTYRVELGPGLKMMSRTPQENRPPINETWTMRSACNPQCVATASTGGQYPNTKNPVTKLVFDDVAGGWNAVVTRNAPCKDGDPAVTIWTSISVRPQPDGTMAGEALTVAFDGTCSGRRTIRLVRTGDADLTRLPDPTVEPPRVASPAEALHGRYHGTVSYATYTTTYETDYVAETHCLRTGDRCITLFSDFEKNQVKAFVFTDGLWARNVASVSKCAEGTESPMTNTSTLALPAPPQNPIAEVSGPGHLDAPECRLPNTDFTERFTRTGD
jgi:serine/threonine protein kinase